ncbi:hypothetical protein [Brevundimonas pishanensis]|uniref:hypothetical protein n=1 Tax=Brevundimonas pishanensis TaxID=2896315 RepID=UPI001FA716E9|nr:hypothetical protein [Brevundimonas pishanensis]
MRKYDRSRTAIILSGIGAILLMVSLYLVFRANLPRLIAVIPLVITCLSLTAYYRFDDFLLKPADDDPASTRRAITLSNTSAIGALAFGWISRWVYSGDLILIWALDVAGLLVLISAMVRMIRLRLERLQRRSG